MQAKKIFPIVIFVLAGLLLVVGIMQLVLFLSPQMAAIESARQQGAAEEMISSFFWQQLMPQVLVIAVTSIGIAAILATCGLLSLQMNGILAPAKESVKPAKDKGERSEQTLEKTDEDDYFEDFESLEDSDEDDD